jgi:plastocyanin
MNVEEDVKQALILVLLIAFLISTAFAGTIEGKAPKNSVVYVNSLPGTQGRAPAQTFTVDQKSMQFHPHILVVPVGSTVTFENHDVQPHNVMWPSIAGDRKLAQNLGTFPPGKKVSFRFDHPGVVPLLCNIHAEMSSFIVITPTRYYATTDAGGVYKIPDVPEGTYQVTAWHEGRKPQSKPVTVVADDDAKLDFAFN